MTIRHLRILIAVADTGRMRLAAKQLYISQPTVSQAIAELERHYESRIFERLNRRLYITAFGTQLLGYARHIVALFDEMELQARYRAGHPAIKVGATLTPGATLLADIVNAFEQAHPEGRVDVYVDNTSVVEAMLLKSALDVGLVEGNVRSGELVCTPFMRDEMVLICAPEHPFAGRKTISAQALAGQRFVLREPGSGTREQFMAYLSERGVQIDEKWVCHASDAIKEAVMRGQGLSVLSAHLVREEAAQKKLHIVRFDDVQLIRTFCIVRHKNKFITPMLQAFLDTCRAQAQSAS
nr:LysR family transcriptional regulator [Maliibacterium massiliense]